jgi:hypothetical protein
MSWISLLALSGVTSAIFWLQQASSPLPPVITARIAPQTLHLYTSDFAVMTVLLWVVVFPVYVPLKTRINRSLPSPSSAVTARSQWVSALGSVTTIIGQAAR